MITSKLAFVGFFVVSAILLPLTSEATYTLEWQAPSGLDFVTDASRFTFSNDRYDMDGDAIPELLLREENPAYPAEPRWTYHVYSSTSHQLLWSYAPDFSSNESQFFGFFDLDADGDKEALFDDDGQSGAVMSVSWDTGAVEWQIAYGYVNAVMDVDADGWDEAIVEWSSLGLTEIWGSGVLAAVHDEDARETESAISFVRAKPNPSSQTIDIRYEGRQSGPVSASIFDVQGRLVRSFGQIHDRSVVWDGRLQDGSQAPAGTYFCEVSVGPEKITGTFVLVR